MRLARGIVLLALCLMLASCGGGSGSSGTINGNWSATLTGTATTSSSPVLIQFTVTLNQTSPPSVDATNFTLSAANSCFSNPATLTSTFSNGAFGLNIASFSGAFQDVLGITGKIDGSTITGNWTFTGGVSQDFCNSSGTFKMTRS